jgi:hypothetical protein
MGKTHLSRSSNWLFDNFTHISADFLIVCGKPPNVCAHYRTLLTVSGKSWLNGDSTVAAGKGLILAPSSSAPSGAAEGMIYYDDNSSVIKMYDGSAWYTVGTSTSGLTLTGNQLKLADLSYYQTYGTTTQQGLSQLTLEASSTAAIPLTLVARSSQTANLFQIRNSGSTNLLFVNSSGGLYASTTLQVTATSTLYNDLTVDTNTLLVDSYNNKVGIGSSTPFTALGITNTGTQLALAYNTANYSTLNTDSSGYLAISPSGLRTGIATTTPLGTLAISTSAGVNPFIIGSSTATYLTVDTSGNLSVDTNTLYVDAANNKVGIGSSTPSSALSVGANMTSTSTMMVGRLCLIAAQENGTIVYLRLGANQAANQPFATSTIPCN